MICWFNYTSRGEELDCCPEEHAIKLQQQAAAHNNYTYLSDEEALDDFIKIHWAWRI